MLLERLMNFISVDLQEAKVFIFSAKFDQFVFFSQCTEFLNFYRFDFDQ